MEKSLLINTPKSRPTDQKLILEEKKQNYLFGMEVWRVKILTYFLSWFFSEIFKRKSILAPLSCAPLNPSCMALHKIPAADGVSAKGWGQKSEWNNAFVTFVNTAQGTRIVWVIMDCLTLTLGGRAKKKNKMGIRKRGQVWFSGGRGEFI